MTPTLDLIDLTARRVEREHTGYQNTIKALLGEFLDRYDAHTPRARTELVQSLHGAHVEALSALTAMLYVGVDDVWGAAQGDVALKVSEALSADLGAIVNSGVETAIAQISDALHMDEDTILSMFRKLQLQAAMKAAQGIDPKVAFDMVKGGLIVGVAFTRRDRAGTAWSTSIYSRTVARALMVDSYTEVFLLSLLSNGIDIAAVPGDDGLPIQFSITGTDPDLPDLVDIQAEYLHPNASRLVNKAPVT